MGIHIYRINFSSTKCSAQRPVYSHRFLDGPSGRAFIAVASQQSKQSYSEKKSFHIISFVLPIIRKPPLSTNQKLEINLKTLNTAYTSRSFESVKPPIRMLVMPATTVALVLLPTPSAPLWVKNPKKQA